MRRLSIAAFVLLAAVSRLFAGETGSVSGVIRDSQGGVLPGATVRVSGPLLPAGREVTTTQTGVYLFPRLLPGAYKVEASLAGMGGATREVKVAVDNDAQVDLILSPTVTETVEVVAEAPAVDLKSTEVNFNYTDEVIKSLPLDRSYAGLFQLVPGVADNRSFAPSAGGSRQDNTYLLDGVNITNPLFGYPSTESNELDIVDFNVKRGAITAEFGRSAGMVTNAVTRSGTNSLSGDVRFEWLPRDFIGDAKDSSGDRTIKASTDRFVPAFGVGGPVVKDTLFWYASGRFFRSKTTDRTNTVGPVPDSETSTDELFAKVTATPSPKHFLAASFRNRPTTVEFAGVGATDSPEVATDDELVSRVATASWNFFATDCTVFEVKYLHLDENGESVARTDLGFQPAFDVNNLARMGYYFDAARKAYVGGASLRVNRANYKRDEVKANVSQYLDLAGAGHQIKAGFGWEAGTEDLTRESNGWGTISRVQNNTQYQAVYYPEQPSQLSKARTYALFLQDTITVGRRLTVNAGVLLNRDEFAQEITSKNTFLTFDFLDEIQPRLGVNYNLREGKEDKVYANWGRYYNLEQKSSARSLAPGRLYTSEALFNLQGGLISDKPSANTVAKNIDPDVKPPYIDELLVGYGSRIRGLWRGEVFFSYRNAKDFIEDAPRTLPSSDFVYSNLKNAKRTYKAVTVEVERRMDAKWGLLASYTWSRFEGNFDLDYASIAIFNTSSILQDGPGLFVEDEFREGPLTEDRTHVAKLFGNYRLFERLTLGGYLRVQSGTPWEARGRDWYNGYRRYLEPAGTNRNDTWTNVDLLTSYRLPVGKRFNVTAEARLLNVFDTQTALSHDNRKYLDGRIRNFTSEPYLVQGTTLPNPDYGKPTSYAPARRLLLTILVGF